MSTATVAPVATCTCKIPTIGKIREAIREELAGPRVTVARGEAAAPIDPLTAREIEVLVALVDGLETNEVAARLLISRETVKNHMNHIFEKTQTANRTQAAVWELRTGTVR